MTRITVNADIRKGKINKNIYGHFSEHLGRCIYEGIWVGLDSPIPNTDGIRNDVIEALREMKIPVLRWPGGCFADEYHWMDGIGPYEKRPRIVNTNWGGVVENNHFGTHEFFRLCELIGAEPYVCGNVGSGTVREMQEWVEYMTSDGESPMPLLRKENGRKKPWHLAYFGIGNESWGCGGNMRAEYYADEYRRYATYVRDFGDNKIYKIACGSSDDKYEWTEILMREAAPYMDGLSLHYYTVPGPAWEHKGSALEFDEAEWFITMKKTLFMDEIITRHSTIMDRYDPSKRVGMIVDEWGTWYDVEPGTHPGFLYQQNTIRDALVTGINLNIFNAHCDRVQMANIAQLVNVLQSLIMTDGEKMILTPTYHVFNMYKVHQDANLLSLSMDGDECCFKDNGIPQISASASIDSDNQIHLSLCNMSPTDGASIDCTVMGHPCSAVSGTILKASAMNAHNTFESPDNIEPKAFQDAVWKNGKMHIAMPPMSVVVLALQ